MKFSKLFFAFFAALLLSSSVSYACVEKAAVIKLNKLGLALGDAAVMINRETFYNGTIGIKDGKEIFVADELSKVSFGNTPTSMNGKAAKGFFVFYLLKSSTNERQYSIYVNSNGISVNIPVNYKIDATSTAAPTEVSFFTPTKDEEIITTGEGCE